MNRPTRTKGMRCSETRRRTWRSLVDSRAATSGMSRSWGRTRTLRSGRGAGIGTSSVTVGDLHERYVHRARPFANTFLPFDQKSFANSTARCTYSECNHTDNPETPVHHEPTDVNDPTTWHRLARSAIGPGDNQCNHAFGGHRHVAAPRVKATHVEVDAGAWRYLK